MAKSVELKLGSLAASEQLIQDLYIDLRRKINRWAALTKQTAQARMGYVGQHLVSVATGIPGGRSGARGKDLVLPDGEYCEIKTCYRVDQLGKCLNCQAVVASIEDTCSACGSNEIKRNDDSKWLIGIRTTTELAELLDPKAYYLVLFEFVDLYKDRSIRSTIWEVSPRTPGFAFCMIDYYFNIRAKSNSGAPFNLWPYELKFDLMKPTLLYHSVIGTDDRITTKLFPQRDKPEPRFVSHLAEYRRSQNVMVEGLIELAARLKCDVKSTPQTKADLLTTIQRHVESEKISNDTLADAFAFALYHRHIKGLMGSLPSPLREKAQAITSGN